MTAKLLPGMSKQVDFYVGHVNMKIKSLNQSYIIFYDMVHAKRQ